MPETGYSEPNKPGINIKNHIFCACTKRNGFLYLYRAHGATEMERSEIEVQGARYRTCARTKFYEFLYFYMLRIVRLGWSGAESKLALRKNRAHGATEMKRSEIEVQGARKEKL